MTHAGEAGALQPARRILQAVRAQSDALLAGRFDDFTRLADERDAAQLALAGPVAPAERSEVLRLLEEARELDRRNVALVQRLLEETAHALGRLRRGHGALQGYARPGAHVAQTAVLDQAR